MDECGVRPAKDQAMKFVSGYLTVFWWNGKKKGCEKVEGDMIHSVTIRKHGGDGGNLMIFLNLKLEVEIF